MAEPDVILNKGSTVPYYGVLVSEPRYREYTEAMRLAKFCETGCQDDKTERFLFAGSGVALGLILGLVMVKK